MAHLILVPTPIGNLGDITLRALEVLKSVDAIAAEDTRHSQKLLNHYHIQKPLLRLDAHTIAERGLSVLAKYERLAFITDAGTPGISDPGAELLKLALENQHTVEVLPGATAFIPALVLSGLPTNQFCFEGFLPRKGRERKERLESISKRTMTTVIYESPQRIVDTLNDFLAICGKERQASLSRELSKQFETTYRGTLQELTAQLGRGEVRGEIVLVIAPAPEKGKVDAEEKATQLLAQGLRGQDLREALIDLGVPRNRAYALSVGKSKP
jgi:16S rRNA (cytidine1402-2'-O)-methyltransferase